MSMTREEAIPILERTRHCLNCHGCKWLDEVRKAPPGSGYCSMVQRSKNYRFMDCTIDCGCRAPEIRRPDDERCELYEAGAWATRYTSPDRRPPEGEANGK